MPIVKECKRCHEMKPHKGRGFCRGCYSVVWHSENRKHAREYKKKLYRKHRDVWLPKSCLEQKARRKRIRDSVVRVKPLGKKVNSLLAILHRRHLSAFLSRKNKVGSSQPNFSFASEARVKDFYLKCPKGYQVDHIIPLFHKEVSGLHNEFNLQYLTIRENNFKKNRFDGSRDNVSWRKVFNEVEHLYGHDREMALQRIRRREEKNKNKEIRA